MYSDFQAAQLAALVMFGWDMCDNDLHCLSPVPDPRIIAAGWLITGYITGGDRLIKSGNGVRRKVLDVCPLSEDRVCYGYLARSRVGEYVAVIRGTDGAEEWLDDFDFIPRRPDSPLQGMADGGFYGIYRSLRLETLAGDCRPLAAGIAQAVATARVTVAGHSLGAALATYLTAELATLLPASQVSACLFASPKPGDEAFAVYFRRTVPHYQIFSYLNDLVPLVPPAGYSPLPDATVLLPERSDVTISSTPACCHHLISYIALLDPAFFRKLILQPDMTPDDRHCAACISDRSGVKKGI
ncbi:lipase family protein [Salmonella enterica subsp. diarizonae]|nr:lipase family protein [Salmonella enterica subsp. diarizonae]